MSSVQPLSPTFAVAPQIALTDLPRIAEAGFKSIICNRPDHEDAGQPTFAQVAEAAAAAGLQARHIPVVSGGIGPEQAQALLAALEELPQPTLAYCRSGTRSGVLWQLAQSL